MCILLSEEQAPSFYVLLRAKKEGWLIIGHRRKAEIPPKKNKVLQNSAQRARERFLALFFVFDGPFSILNKQLHELEERRLECTG